ncbi:hypothetical protein ACFL42_03815, partial [Candidatus Omnitrophota bacterium]
IKGGDIVYYEEASVGDIAPGDIILFREALEGNGAVLHRVIAKTEAGGKHFAIAKGDASASADAVRIDDSRLVGKVISRQRGEAEKDLRGLLCTTASRVIAALSRANLTPALLRVIYLDPFLERLFRDADHATPVVNRLFRKKVDYAVFGKTQIRAVRGSNVLGLIEMEEETVDGRKEYRIKRFWVKHLWSLLGVKRGLIEHARRFAERENGSLRESGAFQK